jgi:hypothetical protein
MKETHLNTEAQMIDMKSSDTLAEQRLQRDWRADGHWATVVVLH